VGRQVARRFRHGMLGGCFELADGPARPGGRCGHRRYVV